MNKIFFAVFFACAQHALMAGNDNFPTGARQSGMGFCGLTLSDPWGAQHNQANLAFVKNYSFGAYYENKFNLKETALKSFTAALPFDKTGSFSLTATQFGSTNYTEGKYGLGYARKLAEHFSAGLQFNFNTIRLGDIYGKKQAFTAEFGIRARLIAPLTFAAHVYNITRTPLHDYSNEYIPTILRFGLEYKFSTAVIMLAETETTIHHRTNIKTGVEYNLKQKVFLRAGINTYPFMASFGAGYQHKFLHLDIAAAYYEVWGFSPNISLHVELGGKNKTVENPK